MSLNLKKLGQLQDALNEIGDLSEVLAGVLNENDHLQWKINSLSARIQYLEQVLEDHGIDPTETRQYRIDAVRGFVETLGV